MSPPLPILFYDGDCGLCARSVQWTLRHDRVGAVRFAPLQGSTYAQFAAAGKPASLETVVFADERGLHVRSDAVLALLGRIGGVWPVIAGVLRIVPPGLRDWGYRLVATRRRRWFGGADSCALPLEKNAGRFLA